MNIIAVSKFDDPVHFHVLAGSRDFRRLFRRLFRRAARLLWSRFFTAARSILETALRYAEFAPSLSFSEISFSSFFMDERSEERWPMLLSRHLVFCRALFLAWGELAKDYPLEYVSQNKRVKRHPYRWRNMVNFDLKVKPQSTLSVQL